MEQVRERLRHENERKVASGPGGMTLIERVVLVAIVCILALILGPVFSRVKEPARQVTCLSNVRQICVAFRVYAAVNANRLPPYRGWPDAILPYVANRKVLACPRDRKTWPGYAYHPPVAGERLESLERPDETALLYDGKDGKLVKRHNEGANYGFADGHAMWKRDPPPGLFDGAAHDAGSDSPP